jgi:hypothetical protein
MGKKMLPALPVIMSLLFSFGLFAKADSLSITFNSLLSDSLQSRGLTVQDLANSKSLPVIGFGTSTLSASNESSQFFPSGAYITLTEYYRLPGQKLSVTGSGFRANEQITVSLFGKSLKVKANNKGGFVTAAQTVPFSAIDRTVGISAVGQTSKVKRAAQLAVGNFYPHVEPSTYFAMPGTEITFLGKGFAPNEPVSISRQGVKIAQVKAQADGTFRSGLLTVPQYSGEYSYVFTGSWSKTAATVNILVAGF